MNRETLKVVLPEGKSLRADTYIAGLGYFTRSQIQHRALKITLADNREVKLSRRLNNNETLNISWEDPPSSEILPEAMDLEILYEDSDLVVINKSQNMVVHPACGHSTGTLVQGLLHRYSGFEETFSGDRVRPGIVHRLDKDTSGVMVVAKSVRTLEALALQFRERSVQKVYLALVQGRPPRPRGEIRASIGRDPSNRKRFTTRDSGGKTSLTRYRTLSALAQHSFLRLNILTGRTHQIRVHMLHLGCPVLGDSLYGRRDRFFPQATLMLHAWRLTLLLPSGQKRTFEAPLPSRFLKIFTMENVPLPEELSVSEAPSPLSKCPTPPGRLGR